MDISSAMKRAIDLATRAWGNTSPNPMVGCVVLDRDGHLLTEGFHQGPGLAHAEVDALKHFVNDDRLKGATVVVTLEPCAHHGRTPPCANFLATLPIARVVYGKQDPNPHVNGRGLEILTAAGIEVVAFAELTSELDELLEIFTVNQAAKRAFVHLKVATSLDGCLALKNKQSQWITGAEARIFSMRLRSGCDGVVVGAGTVIQDNPLLNLRRLDPEESPPTQTPENAEPWGAADSTASFSTPLRDNHVIVIDPRNRIGHTASQQAFAKVHSPERIWVVSLNDTSHPGQSYSEFGFSISTAENGINHLGRANFLGHWPLDLSKQMHKLGVHSLFIEGGSWVLNEFLRHRLADRFSLFMNPSFLGDGLRYSHHLHLEQLTERIELKNLRIRALGLDFCLSGRIF